MYRCEVFVDYLLAILSGNHSDVSFGSVCKQFKSRLCALPEIACLKDLISFGASPRASISLSLAAKAYAFIKRRGYVIPEDVRAVCPEVLRHRIGLTYEAEAENVTTEQIIEQVINAVIVP